MSRKTPRWVLRAVVVATVAAGATGVATPAFAVTGYSAAGVVNLRPAPDTTGSPIAQTADGQALDVRCQSNGENVSGTTIWDFTTVNGRTGYLSDNFVNGTPFAQFDPRIPRCGDAGTRVYGQRASGNLGVGGQCTYGALEQWHNATGYYPLWTGDARYWKDNAGAYGWLVVLDARPRSIVVFQPGVHGADAASGHVAWVESVETRSDGVYVHILEMNGLYGPWTYDRQVEKDILGMSYILAP